MLDVTVEYITGHFNRFEVVKITREIFGSEIQNDSLESDHYWLMWFYHFYWLYGRSAWKDIIFITCFVDVQAVNRSLLFVLVRWHKRLMIPDIFGTKLVKVFAKNDNEKDGPALLMPVQRMCCIIHIQARDNTCCDASSATLQNEQTNFIASFTEHTFFVLNSKVLNKWV